MPFGNIARGQLLIVSLHLCCFLLASAFVFNILIPLLQLSTRTFDVVKQRYNYIEKHVLRGSEHSPPLDSHYTLNHNYASTGGHGLGTKIPRRPLPKYLQALYVKKPMHRTSSTSLFSVKPTNVPPFDTPATLRQDYEHIYANHERLRTTSSTVLRPRQAVREPLSSLSRGMDQRLRICNTPGDELGLLRPRRARCSRWIPRPSALNPEMVLLGQRSRPPGWSLGWWAPTAGRSYIGGLSLGSAGIRGR